MKIAILSMYDDANVGAIKAKSLRSIGYQADHYTLTSHAFRYPRPSKLIAEAEIESVVKACDVLVLSGGAILHVASKSLPFLGSRRLVVFHTGNSYRASMKRHNEILKDAFCTMTRGAIYGHGAPGEVYISNPVDDDLLKYQPLIKGSKPMFYHSPTNPLKKNTKAIVAALNSTGALYTITEAPLSYQSHVNKMLTCDVVIDQLPSVYNGHKIAYFGTTSLEACALGRIAISGNLHHDDYLENYGTFERIDIANNQSQLERLIEFHIEAYQDSEFFESARQAARQWIEDFQGLEAFGKRFEKLALK